MRRRISFNNIMLTGIADKGRAVGRTAAGQVVFVENALPGDVVDVYVFKKKNDVFFARPTRFVSLSSERVKPFCTHFGLCGGCKYQNLHYETQLRYKQAEVENALRRIGKVEIGEILPILPSLETDFYRNKLEYGFSNRRWLEKSDLDNGEAAMTDSLGFHISGAFDKVLDINFCHLQGGISNDIRNFLREKGKEMKLSFFDMRQHVGFLRNIMIRNTTLGHTMLVLSFGHEDEENRQILMDAVVAKFPAITAFYYCINHKVNDFILDLDMILYYGVPHIEEMLGNVRFKIGPKSFFQTNPKQAARLFDVVVDFAELKGTENVYDLYTGLGSIALYMADKCKQVVGVEEIPSAIQDAKENAALNGIKNAIFYAGDVKNIVTAEFAEKHGAPDVVITDPPRIGMHEKLVQTLLDLAAPRIVYVSCNPATQARDLQLLAEKYRVVKVRAVDMFPHTHHIENVALLELIS
jgi:23S rRNA (uracil1939-C5)-methyltransferase